MIFLDEDLIKNRDISLDEATINEDILSISESTNDFITESLNCEINYRENLMEAVYLESNDDKQGAIKKFFNGIIEFVKKIWNSIKGFFTKNKGKIKSSSEKLARVIKVILNDKRFKKVVNSEVRVKGLKISIEASNFYS